MSRHPRDATPPNLLPRRRGHPARRLDALDGVTSVGESVGPDGRCRAPSRGPPSRENVYRCGCNCIVRDTGSETQAVRSVAVHGTWDGRRQVPQGSAIHKVSARRSRRAGGCRRALVAVRPASAAVRAKRADRPIPDGGPTPIWGMGSATHPVAQGRGRIVQRARDLPVARMRWRSPSGRAVMVSEPLSCDHLCPPWNRSGSHQRDR